MLKKRIKDHFQEFVKVVKRLRNECPWDKEQTHQTIRHSLIEEAYEVIEAIDQNNLDELKRELGDLLLHIVMHSIIAEENMAFTLDDVIKSITEKMIRRHPHVFGDTVIDNAQEVKRNWEKIKIIEGKTSVLDGVPMEMPALLRAFRIQEKASKVGFDWKKKRDVWKKINEELHEFIMAERSKNHMHIEEEYGDVLFALVNYSRFLGINPEFALRNSIEKFIRRFHQIEDELHLHGKNVGNVTLEEMDKIWNQKKKIHQR